MSVKIGKRLIFWGVLLALGFPAACGTSGLVGGECGASYVDCDGQCVDAQHDPNNCGGCAHACAAGVACTDARCMGTLEAGSNAGTGNRGEAGEAGASGFGASSASGGNSGQSGGGEAGQDLDAGQLSDA